MVLIQKPFFERGTGSILPQCDGPFAISRLPTLHTAVLEDPLTLELYLSGKPISVARLIRFNFPASWAGPDASDLAESSGDISHLKVGDLIGVEPRFSKNKRVYVARVDRPYYEQSLLDVTLYQVPTHARFGPWQRRPCEIWQEGGTPRREVFTASEVI